MDSYNKETIFHLPGLFRHFRLYQQILYNYKEHSEFFKDNIKIGSVYGCPPVIWNGGRLMIGPQPDRNDLISIRNFMEECGIPARFTFTNCLLEEKHTYDTYGNLLLEIFSTGKHEVICNKEVLENYIRENYGDKFKYISSTTKRLSTLEEQSEELKKDYHLVVLDYDHNKHFDFLSTIENKDKCELLCNAICKEGCKRRTRHYEILSKCQITFDESEYKNFECRSAENDCLYGAMQNKNFISIEDINNTYLPMGFKNFKLEGRTMHPLDMIEVLLYYLIKEEYQPQVRRYLQQIYY